MLERLSTVLTRPLLVVIIALFYLSFQPMASASPFGQGIYGADVPFGSATSLAIALGGNVNLSLAPSGGNFAATGSHTLTITSTDVVGYKLYAYSPVSTNMVGPTDTIPASTNTSAGPLSVNSWGYNTDGSTNYLGMTTGPALIKDTTGPFKNGDNTTVTYAVLASIVKGAGNYTVSVVYTAVAEND